MHRSGKLRVRVFPDKPVTRKPAEARMGRGKGSVDHFVAVVKPGRILFQITGVDKQEAPDAMRLASHKFHPNALRHAPGEGVRRRFNPGLTSQSYDGSRCKTSKGVWK